MKPYYRVLTIAGSDSGSCAGIQADLKTLSALGCFGTTAITTLTAQNTLGVQAIHKIEPRFVQQQIHSVLSDIGSDAIKIGMLLNREVITIVTTMLKKFNAPIILDPVMVSTNGDCLLDEDAISLLKTSLMPLATIITPNIPEAECLINNSINQLDDMEIAAKKIAQMVHTSVLIKGGHHATETATDYFYHNKSQQGHWLESPRIVTKNTHGTGCTLSTAIAAEMARGQPIFKAIQAAKAYINETIVAGSKYYLGQGHGPLQHFCRQWSEHEF